MCAIVVLSHRQPRIIYDLLKSSQTAPCVEGIFRSRRAFPGSAAPRRSQVARSPRLLPRHVATLPPSPASRSPAACPIPYRSGRLSTSGGVGHRAFAAARSKRTTSKTRNSASAIQPCHSRSYPASARKRRSDPRCLLLQTSHRYRSAVG